MVALKAHFAAIQARLAVTRGVGVATYDTFSKIIKIFSFFYCGLTAENLLASLNDDDFII